MTENLQRGQATTVILVVTLALISIFLSGITSLPKNGDEVEPTATPIPQDPQTLCCDRGNGNDCKPYDSGDDKTFTFEESGKRYGLLKSDVTLSEYNAHMLDTGQKTPHGDHPIVKSTADSFGIRHSECGHGVDDQVWGSPDPFTACTAIPNDSVLYVCKENCYPPDRSYHVCAADPSVPCFGQKNAVFDVYFVLDGTEVPDVIKHCPAEQNAARVASGPQPTPGPTVEPFTPEGAKQNLQLEKIDIVQPTVAVTKPPQFMVGFNRNPAQKNLQLKPFAIITPDVQKERNTTPWLSPYCKPAIYLYPKEKTLVNVQIAPKGNLTLTIPPYPNDGWHVIAYPGGNLQTLTNSYDYLYYEAEIPDTLLAGHLEDEQSRHLPGAQSTREGYVVAFDELKNLFDELLPTLSLNQKEQSQFEGYWLNILPKSPYYFVGIVPQNILNNISPLSISPQPDNVIRVTLYFEALDEPVNVAEPKITPVKRDGFTVVEWGGLFKKDKDHPFSCLM